MEKVKMNKDSKEQILKKIKLFIMETNPTINDLETIPLKESLIEGGYLDSIAFFNLIMFIEENYQIEFDGNEISIDTFNNLTQIIDLILKKYNQNEKITK